MTLIILIFIYKIVRSKFKVMSEVTANVDDVLKDDKNSNGEIYDDEYMKNEGIKRASR